MLPAIPAGLIALSFNYGAYMTEIFRAGIQAVPDGQREAAEALGMPERLVMRRIVLPQAVRIVIPAIGNEFVAMIKDSSLVSILAVEELLFRARLVGQQNFRSLEALHHRGRDLLDPHHRLQPLPAASRAVDGAGRPMTTDGEVIVRVEAIEKYFGDHHVLRGIDLEVRQREAVMIMGRSGSGKTTLLRCINFLEEPTAGWVEIDGLRLEADPLQARSRRHQEQIRQMRLRAGMLFQEFNLFPHMTSLGNCMEAPMRVLGLPRATAI